MPPVRPLRHLLRDLCGTDLRPDPERLSLALSDMDAGTWRDLPAALDFHGITLVAFEALQSLRSVVPTDVGAEIRNRALAHRGARLRTYAALAEVTEAMNDRSIRSVLLKGPVLADLVWARAGLRTFSDIDLLVSPRDLDPTLRTLNAIGGTYSPGELDVAKAEQRCELTVLLPSGIPIDLHWGLLGSPELARPLDLPVEPAMETARAATLGVHDPLSVLILSPEHMTVHTAVHAVKAGLGTMRLALDVDQVLRHVRCDPGMLGDLLERSRASLYLDVAARRSARALDGPPRSTVRRRHPWLAYLAVVDRWNPPTRTAEGRHLDFLVSSTRVDLAHSTKALWAHLLERSQRTRRTSRQLP